MFDVDREIPGFYFDDPDLAYEWQKSVFPNTDAITADKVWRDKEIIEAFDKDLATARDYLSVQAVAVANNLDILEDAFFLSVLPRTTLEHRINQLMLDRADLPMEAHGGREWQEISNEMRTYKKLLDGKESLFVEKDGVLEPLSTEIAHKSYFSIKERTVNAFCQRYLPRGMKLDGLE